MQPKQGLATGECVGRKRAKKKDGNGATLGFEQTLWQVAAAACSSSTPMRDGLENTTFSPQAFGERLVVGNHSSWFKPTLGMSNFNFTPIAARRRWRVYCRASTHTNFSSFNSVSPSQRYAHRLPCFATL